MASNSSNWRVCARTANELCALFTLLAEREKACHDSCNQRFACFVFSTWEKSMSVIAINDGPLLRVACQSFAFQLHMSEWQEFCFLSTLGKNVVGYRHQWYSVLRVQVLFSVSHVRLRVVLPLLVKMFVDRFLTLRSSLCSVLASSNCCCALV